MHTIRYVPIFGWALCVVVPTHLQKITPSLWKACLGVVTPKVECVNKGFSMEWRSEGSVLVSCVQTRQTV